MHSPGDAVYPSYLIGSITVVHTDTHSVDIQLYGFVEVLDHVPLFRAPGVVNLPVKDDLAVIIFDNRLKPLVIGWYPKFIRDDINISKTYQLQEGEQLIQSQYGGRMMMLKSGIMRFSNWVDQGIEIDGNSGSFIERSPSKKDIYFGCIQRSGWVRRKGIVNLSGSLSIFEMDNLESLVKKIGSISAPGTLTTTNDPTSIEMYEKRTQIKVPGTQTPANPNGISLYEETIGTGVVNENPAGVVFTEVLSSPPANSNVPTPNPLRRKTVYYDSAGLTPLVTEEVDCFGNINISISSTAANGYNLTTPFFSLHVSGLGAVLTPVMVPLTSLGNLVTNNPVNNDPITGVPLQGITGLVVNTP